MLIKLHATLLNLIPIYIAILNLTIIYVVVLNLTIIYIAFLNLTQVMKHKLLHMLTLTGVVFGQVLLHFLQGSHTSGRQERLLPLLLLIPPMIIMSQSPMRTAVLREIQFMLIFWVLPLQPVLLTPMPVRGIQ